MIPPVYPITDTRISGLSHLEQLKRLIEGGATLIQLREKHASPRDFYEQAAECVAYARLHRVRIIINDRADIASLCNADGVHLGQEDMPPVAARDLLGQEKIIGYSAHSLEQAIAAAATGVDYIAIGPVLETRSKTDPDPIVGLKGVAEVKAAIREVPLVAIGGIDLTNIPDVFRAGADSVAIISGILRDAEHIPDSLRSFLSAHQS